MPARIERRSNCKKKWVCTICAEKEENSEFPLLVKDMQLFDSQYFLKSFRSSPDTFELLLSLVAPYIKKSSLSRKVASPAEPLSITLCYLSTGDAHVTIASSYFISPPVVGRIINDTCKLNWNVLQARKFLSVPSSQDAWLRSVSDFERKWNFPHCLGAVDGKHVVIQAPGRSGSDYFNYKKSHRIV